MLPYSATDLATQPRYSDSAPPSCQFLSSLPLQRFTVLISPRGARRSSWDFRLRARVFYGGTACD